MPQVLELVASLVKSSEVIAVSVRDRQGMYLGEIREIVLNKESGQVSYVVLSFGGFLGVGNKYFALPWRLFHYNKDDDCFVINVTQDKLKNAPGFNKDNWPDVSNKSWGESVEKFYNE